MAKMALILLAVCMLTASAGAETVDAGSLREARRAVWNAYREEQQRDDRLLSETAGDVTCIVL